MRKILYVIGSTPLRKSITFDNDTVFAERKLFKAFDIPYRSVDLDSADYQKDNWGGQIRNVLKVRTGQPTIPQIFVGGEHIGGCTETFDAFNAGKLQKMLQDNGVAIKTAENVNAYSFLPKWLQPR